MNSNHKSTDMANEFQISSLSCLTVSARAHYINYQQQQKRDAYDEIMTVEQQIQSSAIFSKTVICAVCNKSGIGSVQQKYCNGLTLSLQQH